jgi:hypothetical protein
LPASTALAIFLFDTPEGHRKWRPVGLAAEAYLSVIFYDIDFNHHIYEGKSDDETHNHTFNAVVCHGRLLR